MVKLGWVVPMFICNTVCLVQELEAEVEVLISIAYSKWLLESQCGLRDQSAALMIPYVTSSRHMSSHDCLVWQDMSIITHVFRIWPSTANICPTAESCSIAIHPRVDYIMYTPYA